MAPEPDEGAYDQDRDSRMETVVLTDVALPPDPCERNPGRTHFGFTGPDGDLGALVLHPGGHHGGFGLDARLVEHQPDLPQGLL